MIYWKLYLFLYSAHRNIIVMNKFALLFLLMIGVSSVFASDDTRKLYDELDALLLRRDEFCRAKEARIDSIKNLKDGVNGYSGLFGLYNDVFLEYYTYRSDSAFYYLSLAEKMAVRTSVEKYIDMCKINRSLLLATTGYFSQSLEVLNEIERDRLDPSLMFDYYSAYEWVYSVWSEYSADDTFAVDFRNKEMLYNDSILQVLEPTSKEFMYWSGELNARKGNQYEAQKFYEKALEGLRVDTRLYACVTCGLAFAYKKQGNMKDYEKFLIMSAISDITCPLKENLSMQELAMFLYQSPEPDLVRANKYINYSMEDAMFYNNRLRMLEIAKKFPPIVNTYQNKWIDKNRILVRSIYFISFLGGLLVLAMLYIFRQLKLLRAQRSIVTDMNMQLKELNSELLKTNRTREEYVSLFIELCAAYIDKLNKYQDLVKRKVKAKQVDDLLKIANSSKMSDSDARQFFVNFDTAFLTLYPNFVSEFNMLLREGEEIAPTKGEILNTELRIYALVRLGIKDSSRIATLLFYSPQTIYNYRTMVKNKARNREEFEEQVKKVCTIV
ncbi:Uncharacterised protein [uncultured Bacteroides sp.]|nr:Uncharacterised protein [uncultured Bacteroides sp.]